MGGFLYLPGVNGASPWAETAAEGAGNLLECSLGCYSSRLLLNGMDDVAQRLPANPNVCLVSDKVSGTSSAGSGVYAQISVRAWRQHFDEIGSARGVVDSCRSFCSVPGH